MIVLVLILSVVIILRALNLLITYSFFADILNDLAANII
jgi:hypothetical protein